MPTPLRRDRGELSEDQDVNIDEEDDDSLAGKSQTISLIFINCLIQKFACCFSQSAEPARTFTCFFFFLL